MKNNIHFITLFGILFLIFSVLTSVSLWAEEPEPPLTAEMIELLNGSLEERVLRNEDRQLKSYATLKRAELNKLEFSLHDHIAIQSQWQLVSRSLASTEVSPPDELVTARMASSCDFLELRLQCKPPEWFSELLLNAEFHKETVLDKQTGRKHRWSFFI